MRLSIGSEPSVPHPPPGIVRKKGPSVLKFYMRPQLTILTTSQHNFNPKISWGGGHLLISPTRPFLLLIQKILTQKKFRLQKFLAQTFLTQKIFNPKFFSNKLIFYPKKFSTKIVIQKLSFDQ